MMRVLVVDDDKFVTMSLRTILETSGEIEVVATGNNGLEAIELYKQHMPDVLLMDIRMERMTGLEAAEKILAENADAKILFLTTFSDEEYIVKALKIGGKGYMLKQDFDGIVPTIKAVYAGQSVFGGDIVGKIPGLLHVSREGNLSQYGITDKEFEIMQMVAEGLSNREIAAKIYLSEGTIRNYISQMLEKLGLRDRTQLAIFYLKNVEQRHFTKNK